jgi:hypothetical protein
MNMDDLLVLGPHATSHCERIEEMAHVQFGPTGQDACPACSIVNARGIDHSDLAACGIALGLASVAMADSAVEVGELMAQACPAHQQRITQFVGAFSEMAGVDFRSVMLRLGARPSGSTAEATVIHLADGEQTRCGQRALADSWPENERFVHPTRAHQVTCAACRRTM